MSTWSALQCSCNISVCQSLTTGAGEQRAIQGGSRAGAAHQWCVILQDVQVCWPVPAWVLVDPSTMMEVASESAVKGWWTCLRSAWIMFSQVRGRSPGFSVDLLTLTNTVLREHSLDNLFFFHGLLLSETRGRRGRASHLGPPLLLRFGLATCRDSAWELHLTRFSMLDRRVR